MLFIYFLTSLSRSIYSNLTMKGLKYNMSPVLLSKSPLFSPNIKFSLSTLHLSKFSISKSFCSLIHTFNHQMSITLFHINLNNFLSQTIFINNGETNCPYIDRGAYSLKTNFVSENCYYKDFEQYTSLEDTSGTPICQAEDNSGGGVNVVKFNSLSIINVSFTKCSCSLRGGAVLVEGVNKLVIDHCNFSRCHIGEGNCASRGGSGGAALYIGHSLETIINNSYFLNNYIKEDINGESVILIADYKGITDTQIINTEFDNDINVQEDIYFASNYTDSIFKIIHSCFKTDTTKPFILEDFNSTFECTGCSFIQPIFTPSNITRGSYNNETFNFTNQFHKIECAYSATFQFSSSDYFASSSYFTKSDDFQNSDAFSSSEFFSPTGGFSSTGGFTLTGAFSYSSDFTKSNQFTPSFVPTTSLFTASDPFIAVIAKGTKISKGGIAGIIIACLVLLAIIILLIILFLRRKKSAFIPPEDDPMNIDGLEIPINMYD